MRATFIQTLAELAEQDDRILLLTGDLGYMAIEPFADRFPDRFLNVGVAEQNMVGVATGLAEAGFIPFVYSIVTFATLRPYEFIRNGPVWHQLPVRVVGIGGGFEYGPQGVSHHGLEDLGVMRIHPGLTVIAPVDAAQTATALRAAWDLPGPVYFRLGKDERPRVPGLEGRFELGRTERLGDGTDVVFVTTGSIAPDVAAAAERLRADGVSASVVVAASLSPAPTADLAAALGEAGLAVTVEAHYLSGGIGSMVAEVIAEHGLGARLIRCGVRVGPDGECGTPAFLHERHGLSVDRIVETVQQARVGAGSA